MSVGNHNARKNVAFANEVGNEGVFRFIVNHLGCADLLNGTVGHNDDRIRHRKRFFLVVRNVDERNAKTFVHCFKFKLHFLTHFKVQCAEGFVQKKNFGLVDDSAGDGYTLLLTAGKGGNATFFKACKVNDFQSLAHLFRDNLFGKLFVFNLLVALFIDDSGGDTFKLQAKSNVFKNVQVGEESVFLENGVDGPAVGRKIAYILAVQQNFTACRQFEARNHTQGCRFTAARRTEEGDKLAFAHVKIDIFDNGNSVKFFANVNQLDDVIGFFLCFVFHMRISHIL